MSDDPHMRHGDVLHRMALELARGQRPYEEVVKDLGSVTSEALLSIATAIQFIARYNSEPVKVIDLVISMLEKNKATDAFDRFMEAAERMDRN